MLPILLLSVKPSIKIAISQEKNNYFQLQSRIECGLLICFDSSNRQSHRKMPIEKTNLKNQPHFEVQADIEKWLSSINSTQKMGEKT